MSVLSTPNLIALGLSLGVVAYFVSRRQRPTTSAVPYTAPPPPLGTAPAAVEIRRCKPGVPCLLYPPQADALTQSGVNFVRVPDGTELRVLADFPSVYQVEVAQPGARPSGFIHKDAVGDRVLGDGVQITPRPPPFVLRQVPPYVFRQV